MPWAILIPAIQAVLTAIIQAVGQHRAQLQDQSTSQALGPIAHQHKSAFAHLNALVQQAPTKQE